MFSASAFAGSFGFTASVSNNISGSDGADLAARDLVTLGTWDGRTFSALASTSASAEGYGNGFFNGSVSSFNTNSIAGSQLALQWTEAASGLTGLIYYDITTGSDPARVAQWTVKAGDGGGLDLAANFIDVSDLTQNIAGEVLDAAAVLDGVNFRGSNELTGNPEFQLISLPVTSLPVISEEPASQVEVEGGAVTFTVSASGPDLSFQWEKDGVEIAGATSSTYSLSRVTASDSGEYTVTISNSDGSMTSEAATLSIPPTWEPSGWVYYTWPYAYSFEEGNWHFFNTEDTQFRINLSNVTWGTLSEATGWHYYTWPYAYSSEERAWYWYNEDTQWVVDLVSGIWSRFGGARD